MKSCPACKRTYEDDTLRFCLDDGAILTSAYDPQATLMMPPPGTQSQIDIGKSRRVAPDTIQSPGVVTTPRLPPYGQPEVRRGREGLSRRWPLFLIPVFVLLLIPVLAGGIWIFARIISSKSERRWLEMLSRGQVNVPVVIRETTAELVDHPQNVMALRARSGAYYVSNESDQGKRDAEEVERLLSGATTADEYEARCYARWRLGKPDQAVSDCTRAIELDPKFVWPYHNRANAYNDERDFVKALVDWNKAIDLDPKFVPAYNNRGVYYTNSRDYVHALSDLSKAIELDPQYAVAYDSRGNVYGYQGDYDKALADYNKSIDLDPNDARSYNFRGQIYSNKSNYDRAITDFNKAIELNPRFAWAFDNRGSAYYYKGQLDRALSDYNEALRIDPQWSWSYQNRGNIYYGRKDYDRAIADYDKAVELNPQLAWAYNGRGLCYYYKGNLDQAISDYNKAIDVDPQHASPFYNNRGIVYYYRKDYARAIADYNKAIELDPRYALAYDNRANAYQMMGDNTAAAADREKSKELKK